MPPSAAALIKQAEQQRQAGDFAGAAASLERALRISPRDPYLWNRLARVRLDQGLPGPTAAQLAARSNAYAQPGSEIAQDNARIIAASQQPPPTSPASPGASTTAPTKAVSTSINCGPAATPTQSAICTNAELTVLEQELARLYRSQLQEATGEAANRLRTSLQRWLADRDECGADVSCLGDRYRKQIAWLRSTAAVAD